MKRTIFHVIGITQHLGTCKFHFFRDCHQLQKRRVSRRAWADQVSTGAIIEAEYELYDVE